MSNPRENPRVILQMLEQSARKRFGQNFLTRSDIVARMVKGARIGEGDTVVEVGPGLGILTEELVRVGAKLTAVELDRDLATYIEGQFADVAVIQGDAMRQDWPALFPEGGVKMVANLPYNIGTQLVLQVLQLPQVFFSMTVMLQHEVVARISAQPGNKTYGALSVMCQARGQPRFLLPVPPECFHPQPKVQSAVLLVELFESARTGGVPPDFFDRVVKAAFSQRRKTVVNSLKAGFGRDRAAAALAQAGIDAGLRAERIDVDGYRRLAAALHAG